MDIFLLLMWILLKIKPSQYDIYMAIPVYT